MDDVRDEVEGARAVLVWLWKLDACNDHGRGCADGRRCVEGRCVAVDSAAGRGIGDAPVADRSVADGLVPDQSIVGDSTSGQCVAPRDAQARDWPASCRGFRFAADDPSAGDHDFGCVATVSQSVVIQMSVQLSPWDDDAAASLSAYGRLELLGYDGKAILMLLFHREMRCVQLQLESGSIDADATTPFQRYLGIARDASWWASRHVVRLQTDRWGYDVWVDGESLKREEMNLPLPTVRLRGLRLTAARVDKFDSIQACIE